MDMQRRRARQMADLRRRAVEEERSVRLRDQQWLRLRRARLREAQERGMAVRDAVDGMCRDCVRCGGVGWGCGRDDGHPLPLPTAISLANRQSPLPHSVVLTVHGNGPSSQSPTPLAGLRYVPRWRGSGRGGTGSADGTSQKRRRPGHRRGSNKTMVLLHRTAMGWYH